MSAFLKRSTLAPTVTESRLAKRASPKYTSMPMAASLSAETNSPRRARTRRTRSMTARKSTAIPLGTSPPSRSASRISPYKRDVRMIVLDGMQPVWRQLPPSR